MNELNNVANVNGTYDNIPTSLTSNTSVVNLPVESSQVYCEVYNFTLSTVTLSLTMLLMKYLVYLLLLEMYNFLQFSY